jgi:hypothetical protein
MGQRFNLGRADRKVGIKKVGEPDPISLRRQAQKPSVRIKRICPAGTYKLKTRFLPTIDEPLGDSSIDPENQIDGVGAKL